MGEGNHFSNDIIINIDHCMQRATWDCGLSCIMMVLCSSTRKHFVDNFVEICEAEGIDKSTWSIDLAYLLKRFGIKHLYYTITLGIDPSYNSEIFYKNVLQKDYERISKRFAESSSNGIIIEKKSLSLYEIINHLSQGGLIIVLVNANLLVCDNCLQGGFTLRACLPRSSASYQGHYIVVVGYNHSSSTIFYRNPSLKNRVCSLSFSAFDKARCSYGTDEDIIFIYTSDNIMQSQTPTK